jgi:hypothetical protein
MDDTPTALRRIDMDAMREAIIAAIGLIIGTLALNIWTRFAKNGPMILETLNQVKGLRTIATIAMLGFFLALSSFVALFWRFFLTPQDMQFQVFGGDWSGISELDPERPSLYAASVGQKECPPGSVLISAFCTPTDALLRKGVHADLQQYGLAYDGRAYCSWNASSSSENFVGKAQAVCLKLSKQ